jgi:hypothetical protein
MQAWTMLWLVGWLVGVGGEAGGWLVGVGGEAGEDFSDSAH